MDKIRTAKALFIEKDFGYFFWNYTVSENMRNNCVFPYNML